MFKRISGCHYKALIVMLGINSHLNRMQFTPLMISNSCGFWAVREKHFNLSSEYEIKKFISGDEKRDNKRNLNLN
jgi:hypothetical protein